MEPNRKPATQPPSVHLATLTRVSAPGRARSVSAHALGGARHAPAVPALTAVLRAEEESLDLRCDCALALGQIGEAEAVNALAAVIHDRLADGGDLLVHSAQALGETGAAPTDLMARAVAALRDPGQDLDLRCNCALVLEYVGGPQQMGPLAEILLDPGEAAALRECCALAMTVGGTDAIEPLRTILADPGQEERLRRYCADSLMWIGGPKAQQALLERVTDSSDTDAVRGHCALCLEDLAGEEAVQPMTGVILDLKEPATVRRASLRTLAHTGRATVELLTLVLDDRTQPDVLRMGCPAPLAEAGASVAMEPLGAILTDADEPTPLRWMCASALSSLPGGAVVGPFVAALNDRTLCDLCDPDLSAMAAYFCPRGLIARTLERIGGDESMAALSAVLLDADDAEHVRVDCVGGLVRLTDAFDILARVLKHDSPTLELDQEIVRHIVASPALDWTRAASDDELLRRIVQVLNLDQAPVEAAAQAISAVARRCADSDRAPHFHELQRLTRSALDGAR